MTSVKFHKIHKSFGASPVIQGVDFEILDGEFVVLVGPSGCGKTTLLRMLAGLEDVTAGEISIDERIINDVDPKDRDIAMVFQSYALYPHMNVEQNMGFSLKMRDVAANLIVERVAKTAKILDLTVHLKKFPRELSGGQRQRVAMGRAIVRAPKVFLFDEPLSNLDAKLRVAMRAEIKSLHQRLKTTTVYVTHDQVEAMTMADRIVVMNGGRVAQVGAPLDLYDRPANLFVAEFLGSPGMNTVQGRIGQKDGKPVVISTDQTNWPLPSGFQAGMASDVTYGIRPEHVMIEESGRPNPFKAVVDMVEPTGAATELSISFASNKMTILVTGRTKIKPGDVVYLSVDKDHAHVFDRTTGIRL